MLFFNKKVASKKTIWFLILLFLKKYIEVMKKRYFVIGKKSTGGRPLYRKIITHAESPDQARHFAKHRLPRGFQIIDVQKD